jgi:hypothetical protein
MPDLTIFLGVKHPVRNTLTELPEKEKRIVIWFIDIEQNIIFVFKRRTMFFINVLPLVITYFRLIIKRDLSIYENLIAGLLSYLYVYKLYKQIRISTKII